jgi:hypothetical protein
MYYENWQVREGMTDSRSSPIGVFWWGKGEESFQLNRPRIGDQGRFY